MLSVNARFSQDAELPSSIKIQRRHSHFVYIALASALFRLFHAYLNEAPNRTTSDSGSFSTDMLLQMLYQSCRVLSEESNGLAEDLNLNAFRNGLHNSSRRKLITPSDPTFPYSIKCLMQTLFQVLVPHVTFVLCQCVCRAVLCKRPWVRVPVGQTSHGPHKTSLKPFRIRPAQ